MVKHSKDPVLRKAIRAELLAIHKQNQRIDRVAITAKYTKQKPKRAEYISDIVEAYSNHLEQGLGKVTTRPVSPQPVYCSASSYTSSSDEESLPPSKVPQKKAQTPFTFGQTAAEAKFTFGAPTVPKTVKRDVTNTPSEPSESDETDSDQDTSDVTGASSDEDNGLDNALLQDFKEDLAGARDEKETTNPKASMPPMKDQLHLLTSGDEEEEATGATSSVNLEHAVLVSAALEEAGHTLPSQFALMGKLNAAPNTEIAPDPRVVLNTNVPFSAFICGLQGSGKSHTTSCIIENCSMGLPVLGKLKQSVSTLVLHFNEYSSNVNSQPSEAAFLASVLPQYASQQKRLPVRVLVSPTNYHNLAKMYSQIPNVEAKPFRLNPKHLNIGMMLSLMSMSQSDGMPLYMAQVLRVLREMAIESGGHFDYRDFRKRLDNLRLDRAQTPFLAQRLDLLDSYLDLKGAGAADYFLDGGVTILDLSCPFVDQSTACVLFRIAIDLFLYAHPSRGKMIVADEAHKYMTDSAAAKELTETFLTIIRQQRHLGVRTIISTQEPTISPRLIDLCSITFIHRFTSPDWYKMLRSHIPIDKGNDNNEHGMPDGLYRIANLRTGEALVFAPSAQLVDENENDLHAKHEVFRLKVRKRITWDGGRTIVCVRS
ncbi:hypothetical protein BJX68DRAFT_90932 [Aspergillus pseudodeflectus]|uniref:Zona occludens toxin N-terminal domain-containing protein n=1 Tax=Aspergillus pseudodeflectus TaxID=176178 RepID=A0ABR4KEF3_9EURO